MGLATLDRETMEDYYGTLWEVREKAKTFSFKDEWDRDKKAVSVSKIELISFFTLLDKVYKGSGINASNFSHLKEVSEKMLEKYKLCEITGEISKDGKAKTPKEILSYL